MKMDELEREMRLALRAAERPSPWLNGKLECRLREKESEGVYMHKKRFGKTALLTLLACLILTTGALALGPATGLFTVGRSLPATEVTGFDQLAKLADQAELQFRAPETLGSGFAFASAQLVKNEETDESGTVYAGYKSVDLTYENAAGEEMALSVYPAAYTRGDPDAREQVFVRDGVEYGYLVQATCRLPLGYEMSEEELAQMEDGTVWFDEGDGVDAPVYGTDYFLSWQDDDLYYILYSMDRPATAEEMLAMAAGIMASPRF